MNTVCPSGGAASTAWLEIAPPAPGRFSMTTGCFHSSATRSPRTRARTSPELPGAAPVMNRTGLLGKSWALAAPPKATPRERINAFETRPISPPNRSMELPILDAEIARADGGVVGELARGAVVHHPALAHDVDAIGMAQ